MLHHLTPALVSLCALAASCALGFAQSVDPFYTG
ncbi:MAG: hypothetical protein JWL62_2667, partial [Hyphomicrobiales bacterium]|nr:hypothetical protein [Hyphomicrobiales bacterium]